MNASSHSTAAAVFQRFRLSKRKKAVPPMSEKTLMTIFKPNDTLKSQRHEPKRNSPNSTQSRIAETALRLTKMYRSLRWAFG